VFSSNLVSIDIIACSFKVQYLTENLPVYLTATLHSVNVFFVDETDCVLFVHCSIAYTRANFRRKRWSVTT